MGSPAKTDRFYAGGAPALVVQILTRASEPVGRADLIAAVERKGHTDKAAKKAIENLVISDRIIKLGERASLSYCMPDQVPAPLPQLASSLGTACAPRDTGGEQAKARRAQLLEAIDDDELCMADLLDRFPTWGRSLIAAEIQDALLSGDVASRHDDVLKADVYRRIAVRSEAGEQPDRQECDKTLEACAARFAGAHEPFQGAQRTSSPTALRERLEAICADLVDACDDACDARLPHEVLKALFSAQRDAHRALRQVEAA